MIDHVLGRPSVKSRRLQVLAVLAFWSTYMFKYSFALSLELLPTVRARG
jgi:hypothetical protein